MQMRCFMCIYKRQVRDRERERVGKAIGACMGIIGYIQIGPLHVAEWTDTRICALVKFDVLFTL